MFENFPGLSIDITHWSQNELILRSVMSLQKCSVQALCVTVSRNRNARFPTVWKLWSCYTGEKCPTPKKMISEKRENSSSNYASTNSWDEFQQLIILIILNRQHKVIFWSISKLTVIHSSLQSKVSTCCIIDVSIKIIMDNMATIVD